MKHIRIVFHVLFAATSALAIAGGPPLPDTLFREGFEAAEFADIRPLSDEFGSAATLGDWRRVRHEEHWPIDQIEHMDIDATRPGWLTVVPHTSGWYEDYRGDLGFKLVAGDFVVTTRVDARNRTATGAPGSTMGGSPNTEFSLAGIMIRAPRTDVVCCDASWWQPGGERYIFLSFGSASQTGAYQFETKTTRAAIPPETNSVSVLEIGPASAGPLELRAARIGIYVILLVRESGQPWRVQRRIARTDLPLAMQVGITVYTDWATVSTYPVPVHNTTQITHAYLDPGTAADPDLQAQFDFYRFARPQVPAELIGLNLADPNAVSDAQLLAFLGN